MNADAEAEIGRLAYKYCVYMWDGPGDLRDEVTAVIRAAMAWAYEDAAKEVESHWNSLQDVCNQRDQAHRSAEAIRRLATRPEGSS